MPAQAQMGPNYAQPQPGSQMMDSLNGELSAMQFENARFDNEYNEIDDGSNRDGP